LKKSRFYGRRFIFLSRTGVKNPCLVFKILYTGILHLLDALIDSFVRGLDFPMTIGLYSYQSLKNLQRQVGLGSGFSTLTINQFHYIDTIPQLGEPTITEIAEESKITTASVPGGINKLILLGFGQKTRSSDDRRFFHVRLTRAAQDLVIARQFEDAITKIPRLFKDRERKLGQLTDRLERGMEE
jgi:DNA-binding MarR family transcriptional regulator